MVRLGVTVTTLVAGDGEGDGEGLGVLVWVGTLPEEDEGRSEEREVTDELISVEEEGGEEVVTDCEGVGVGVGEAGELLFVASEFCRRASMTMLVPRDGSSRWMASAAV